MNSIIKKTIYDIITNINFSIEEKYSKIKESFPNYLSEKDQKKVIYEKIEWIFHDWLWTYFELLLFDKISNFYWLNLPCSDKEVTLDKMENWILLYEKFFPNNDYDIDFRNEIKNIKNWAQNSLIEIKNKVWNYKIIKLTHSAQDYSIGNARDIYITLQSGEDLNFSLKTDKSWKVAISDGQTPKIFEKVYNRYFDLSAEDYESLKLEYFETADEKIIFEDFQNVALLTQIVLLKQFNLEGAEINNFKAAKIKNSRVLEYFIDQLKIHKNWKDNASVLFVDRLSWEVGFESILDNIFDINVEDFSFTPTIPRNYKYATEPWIKYKWKTFVSFQTKHKRGKNPSNKFQDITIRLRSK